GNEIICKESVEKKNIFGGYLLTLSRSFWFTGFWGGRGTALPLRFFLHGCRVAESAEIIGKIKRGMFRLNSGIWRKARGKEIDNRMRRAAWVRRSVICQFAAAPAEFIRGSPGDSRPRALRKARIGNAVDL